MPELDEKKRIIAYDTVNDPDENYYALIDNGTAGTGKVSIKGLGPADMISDQYSDSSTYKVGDLCIHNNKLYVCTVAINTPHAFNLSEWELDTLGNYASQIKQSLSNLILDDITLNNQTTNSQGMIVTNLNFDGRWVSAYVGGGRYASFRPSGSDKLVIRLVNDNGEAVTNTIVNVTLYHLGPIS